MSVISSSGSSYSKAPPGPSPATVIPPAGRLVDRPAAGRFAGDQYLSIGPADNKILYEWTGTVWVVSGALVVNGTATLLNAIGQIGAGPNAENDGQRHLIVVAGIVIVTALETGGALSLQWTANGVVQTVALDAGGHAAGTFPFSAQALVDAGQSAFINQTSALTAGAASVAFTAAQVA